MFDRGLNWEKREDGTILYRRSPSGPTFIIDEQTLGRIVRFRFMIPLVSFLTLIPTVVLGVFAGHGEVSLAIPVAALLFGVAAFYLYFRRTERRIEWMLAGARRSSQAPEPFKPQRNARNWKTLDDGSVFYWPRNWPNPVMLTAKQFASIGVDNGYGFCALFVSVIIAVLADGYRWAGGLNNGAASVIAVALISFNVLFIARIRRTRQRMLDRAPLAPVVSGLNPPLKLLDFARLIRMKLVRGSRGMLLFWLLVAVFGLFQSVQTLSDLFGGVRVYWDKGKSFPVGPVLPSLAFVGSLLLAMVNVSAIVMRARSAGKG
ncbi:hypothetical protein GFB56_03540 [Ensifer sp. T173]|uniref:DUF4328 domain-containing protein n=1 Tax=Ensifer canadensis TaxID=555315 RepID=A0AAW4FGP6_9HYPH|nr:MULTISPECIES: hypothetical protein [Ensifer]MBD9485751.1 hypothetical protein [Ensifer sp. ENS11]MBM3089887.1 hypothetical protein [Ensifer canadensis]UBI75454.1 hypothetical protein J3R84_18795 [Ensifer canadensis]